MGSRDQTQLSSLGGKCLYLLSHLTNPTSYFETGSHFNIQDGLEFSVLNGLDLPASAFQVARITGTQIHAWLFTVVL